VIISTCFHDLQTDTCSAGEKEVRCWVVQKGTLAPQAAGVIHGDFERGFIKAEVVAYQDFHDLCEGGKSMGPIKAAGKFRQEGKTYVVQAGDIIHFQFSEYFFLLRLSCYDANLSRCCSTQEKVAALSIFDLRGVPLRKVNKTDPFASGYECPTIARRIGHSTKQTKRNYCTLFCNNFICYFIFVSSGFCNLIAFKIVIISPSSLTIPPSSITNRTRPPNFVS